MGRPEAATMQRRRFLAVCGAGLLAGCPGWSGDDTPDDTGKPGSSGGGPDDGTDPGTVGGPTLSVSVGKLQPALVAMSTPDSIGVYSADRTQCPFLQLAVERGDPLPPGPLGAILPVRRRRARPPRGRRVTGHLAALRRGGEPLRRRQRRGVGLLPAAGDRHARGGRTDVVRQRLGPIAAAPGAAGRRPAAAVRVLVGSGVGRGGRVAGRRGLGPQCGRARRPVCRGAEPLRTAGRVHPCRLRLPAGPGRRDRDVDPRDARAGRAGGVVGNGRPDGGDLPPALARRPVPADRRGRLAGVRRGAAASPGRTFYPPDRA